MCMLFFVFRACISCSAVLYTWDIIINCFTLNTWEMSIQDVQKFRCVFLMDILILRPRKIAYLSLKLM